MDAVVSDSIIRQPYQFFSHFILRHSTYRYRRDNNRIKNLDSKSLSQMRYSRQRDV